MANQLDFQKKLGELVIVAQKNDNKLSREQVIEFFEADNLTEEQMDLLNDYLLAKKIAVTGYVKMEQEESRVELSESELDYLKEYEDDLKVMKPEEDGEMVKLYQDILSGDNSAKMRLTEVYLPYVISLVKPIRKDGFHISDLIQEGNVSLMMALEGLPELTEISKEEVMKYLNDAIKQGVQMLIEETNELRTRDQKMVDQVTKLDEVITKLTEDLGRKVTLEELALYTEMSEDEIIEILKLMGEEVEEAPEMDFKVEEGKLQ